MAEAIHCPSCSTRYQLRPERLKPVIRRAKCYSCGSLFPVGDVVQRLLTLPAPNDTSRFKIEEVDAAQHTPIEPAAQEATAQPDSSFFLPPPSLTLGDLEGVDEEILEKTLVEAPSSLPETKAEPASAPMTVPEPALLEAPTSPESPAPPEVAAAPEALAPSEALVLPETAATPEPTALPAPEAADSEFPPELTEATLSGYTSARDAIDKLLGNAPAPVPGLRLPSESSGMDMEATLSVLDSTLSGSHTVPILARTTKGDSPTASGWLGDAPSASTMRLSREDLEAALASPPRPRTEEPTAALKPSDLMVLPEEAIEVLPPSVPKSFPASTDSQETGSELLRLKIGEEIYSNLTMTQLTAWVEEGRILENHLVARQHSENWLEAHKVPGLRPVFERLRRERNDVIFHDSTPGEIAPKRSLFGGLFGKG